jgi:hypothetical protein
MELRDLFPLDVMEFDEMFGVHDSQLPTFDTTVRIFKFTDNPEDPEEYLDYVADIAYDLYAETEVSASSDDEDSEDRKLMIEEDQRRLDEGEAEAAADSSSESEDGEDTWIIVKATGKKDGRVIKSVDDLEELWHRYNWDEDELESEDEDDQSVPPLESITEDEDKDEDEDEDDSSDDNSWLLEGVDGATDEDVHPLESITEEDEVVPPPPERVNNGEPMSFESDDSWVLGSRKDNQKQEDEDDDSDEEEESSGELEINLIE